MKGIVSKLPAMLTAIATAGILAGYASIESGGPYEPAPRVAQRTETGVVERIELFREGQSVPTGLGAVLGAVEGGVLGHQIGNGGATPRRRSRARSAERLSETTSRKRTSGTTIA